MPRIPSVPFQSAEFYHANRLPSVGDEQSFSQNMTLLASASFRSRRRSYCFVIFVIVCSLGSFFLLYLPNGILPTRYTCHHEHEHFESHSWKMKFYRKSDGRPRIVFWARQYHCIDWELSQLANGDGDCDISFRREDVEVADAVVFFMKSCEPNDRPPPESRRKNQVYVWFSHESPWSTNHYYSHELTEYNNYFNWTMTYRTDSDVVAAMWPSPAMDFLLYRIGRNEDMVDKNLAKKPTLTSAQYGEQTMALLKKKKKLVAWIVSDCHLTSGAGKRMETVNELEEAGLEISKYGKCVGNPLPFNFTIVFETLSSYKFYLAFENSLHCRDYLTEKTAFNSLISGSVPVIYGPLKKDVEKILPSGSYIHVEDFQNMKQLTNYLHHLDNDDSAYLEYFKWWMDPGAQTYPRFGFNFGPSYVPRIPSLPQYNKNDVQDDWLDYERFGLYHLCRRLKRGDHIDQTHVVKDLAKWWYRTELSECRE